MSFTTITDPELVGLGVTGLPDTPELSTEDMQAQFDEYPQFLKDKFRTHITEEEADTAAANIGAEIPVELTNVSDEKVQPILNELATRVKNQKDWQDAADENFSSEEINTTAFHADDEVVTVPTVATNDASTNAASTANVDAKISAYDTALIARTAQNTAAGLVGATVPATLPESTNENAQSVLDAIAAEAHANTTWRNNAESAFETDDLKTDAFHATDTEVHVPTVDVNDWSTKAASTAYVQENMQAASMGDMRKAVYDPNNHGYVDSAEKLYTARTITTDLASETGASFDGSANVDPGVKGILPVTHGGTGCSSLSDFKKDLLLDNVDNTSDADKPVSTATQTALDGKAPTDHKSTTTDYGKGSNTYYGHVKLSDSTSSTNSQTSGVAATPKAVKRANDTATAALVNEGYVESTDKATTSHTVGEYIVYGTGQQFAKVTNPISANESFTSSNVENTDIGTVLSALNSALTTLDNKAEFKYKKTYLASVTNLTVSTLVDQVENIWGGIANIYVENTNSLTDWGTKTQMFYSRWQISRYGATAVIIVTGCNSGGSPVMYICQGISGNYVWKSVTLS